jgi:hypothetical protein
MAGPIRFEGGKVSDPSRPNVKEQTQTPSVTVRNANTMRRVVDTFDGSVKSAGPRTVDTTSDRPSTNVLSTAVTMTGAPVSPDAVTDDTLITHMGMQSRASDLLALGILQRDQNGRIVEAGVQPQSTPQPEAKQEQKQEDTVKPVTFTAEFDKNVRDVVKVAGDAPVLATLDAVVNGRDATKLDADLASRMGVEVADIVTKREAITNEIQSVAHATLQQIGVDGDDFRSWAESNRRGDLYEAVVDLFDRGDSRKLVKLGNDYKGSPAGARDSAASNMLSSAEVDTVARSLSKAGYAVTPMGRGYAVDLPGHGTMPLSEAVSRGILILDFVK